MKYFLAIVPPAYLAQQIEEFRAPWGQAKTTPHITVKAPNSLREPRGWLPQVIEVCQQIEPFEVTMAGVGQFGTTTLYIQVASPELLKLHQALLHIVNPPQAEQAEYFEGNYYLPHLTLAHIESGITAEVLTTMLPLARVRWAPPIRFVASSLVLYQSAGAGKPYVQHQSLPFTGLPMSLGQMRV